MSFHQIPELLSKVNEPLKQKTHALMVVVDDEVKAQRIAPGISQSLNSALFSSNSRARVDGELLLKSVNLPMENDAVANAVNAFLEADDLAQSQRAILARLSMEAIAKRVTELTRTAKTSTEVAPVEAAVYSLFTETAAPGGSNTGYAHSESLSDCFRYLHALRQYFSAAEARPTLSPSAFSQILSDLSSAGHSAREFVSDEDLRKRISRALEPLRSADEAARKELNQALLSRKPPVELESALNAYKAASSRRFSPLEDSWMVSHSKDREVYERLVEISAAVARQDWNYAKLCVRVVKHSISVSKVERRPELEALLSQWEQELKNTNGAAIREIYGLLNAKLNDAKTPADLRMIAAEFEERAAASATHGDPSLARHLSNDLSSLAEAWSSLESNPNNPQRLSLPVGSGSPFAGALADFQFRIVREFLVRTLPAPELNQPPLAEKPVALALESLCDDLAARGAWQRLLRLLERGSETLEMRISYPGRGRTISSLRSFLAAQNFEKAEQWTDAALDYKTVLLNAAELTPIQESAVRLNVLSKEHSDDVRAAHLPPPDVSRESHPQ